MIINNIKYTSFIVFLVTVCIFNASSTENPPFILKDWNYRIVGINLGEKVKVRPNELTDSLGTSEGRVIRVNNDIIEVEFVGKDGKTKKGIFKTKDILEERVNYEPEVAKEFYDKKYDDLDNNSSIYYTTERKIRCGSKEFQDKHPGHKEICTQKELRWGTQDFIWKKVKSLKLKPLKNFVSVHRNEKQRKDNIRNVDFFLNQKKYKCNDLIKYKRQEMIFIDRCYYAYSPIDKYEYFIVIFHNSQYSLYCGKDPKIAVHRITENFYPSLSDDKPESYGDRIYFVGQCTSSPFTDSFYSQNKVFSWGGNPCSSHTITRSKGGYIHGPQYISYSYSACVYEKPENKIDFKSSCTAYQIESPMNYSGDVCTSK